VDNLGANLWGHSEEGKTASIRAGRIHYHAHVKESMTVGIVRRFRSSAATASGIHFGMNRDH